ncbi:MAG: 50S ribosomal protein L11 methyltransferase [Lachnospiraceae bacterium]|nr:50S ribosomal protein L11 methyltransferase [Lachnospiraceae bacterium]
MEWKKFTLSTTTGAVDLISGVLMENGIDTFEIEDHRQISKEDQKAMYIDILPEMEDNGQANIIFYMDMGISNEEQEKVLTGIKAGIDELKDFADVGNVVISEGSTNEIDWINKWKEFFKPFAVDDILIRPTWESVENESDYQMVIKIDPGTAFGTGLHETTQLCIRQLRKYLKEGDSLLDVGCGSGILSIIGKKLGAGTVFGIDIDERAVSASVENAKENDVNPIRFLEGNMIDDQAIRDEAGYECYDIVVANILADIIIPLSEVIAPHLKVGGLFVTSGIINNKEADVVAAMEKNPALEVVEITRQKDWVNVTARKI